MPLKMLVSPPISEARLEKLREAAGSMSVVMAQDEAEALREIADADCMFGYLTPPMLHAATKLRWTQSPTASMEKYLYPELVASPVVVTNMRGIFSDVIADHVFGFILSFAKNLHIYLRQQLLEVWHMIGRTEGELPGYAGPGEVHPSDVAAVTLADSTLGIVGWGGIGQEIGRRGIAFGMRVLAVDPRPAHPLPDVTLWPTLRLDDLLAESDFVVIAAPHTPETFKLFDRARIQKMKQTAFLINVGRGVIIDLADLTASLQANEIAGAGLDVLETEPLPKGHPLWKMPNVIITPHCAAASPRVPERHLKTLLENTRRFVAGEPLMNVVDKSQWY